VDSIVDVLDVDRVRETEQEKLQHCMRKWSRGHQHVDALLSVNSDIIIIIITGSPYVVVAKFINMLVLYTIYFQQQKFHQIFMTTSTKMCKRHWLTI